MFHKFNDTSIITGFIQALLASTNIPLIDIWCKGKPITAGKKYVTKQYIVEAKENCDDLTIDFNTALNRGYFSILEQYITKKHYNGITSNYVSNSGSYDATLHFYLGQYLRYLRDLHNLDLMSLYNCYDNTVINNIRLDTVSNSIITNNTFDDGFKVLAVPILLNQEYSVYINSDYPIEIMAAYWDGNLVATPIVNSSVKLNYISKKTPYVFSIPYVADKTNTSKYLRNYVTLFIQVPKNIKSNLVVLEGNYLTSKPFVSTDLYKYKLAPKIFGETFDNLNDIDANSYYKVLPSLALTTSNETYAFSYTLIEYLLQHAINEIDNISKNIAHIQKCCMSAEMEKLNDRLYDAHGFTLGVWDNSLRIFIYNLMHDKSTKATDVLGYVDKDAESFILRGQHV